MVRKTTINNCPQEIKRAKQRLSMLECHGYKLDEDGKILCRKEFFAADEADALRAAHTLFPADSCEVWSGKKMIGRVIVDASLSTKSRI